MEIGDIFLLARERSERDTEASETLSGVTQSRFRYIYLLASERSERDTLSRSSMENAIRIYIYIYINTIADFVSHRKCIA